MTGEQIEPIGSDSFTDVVTNIVGILIILVMIVGIRVRHAPATAVPDERMVKEASRSQSTAIDLERDIQLQERKLAELSAETVARRGERDALALAVAAAQREREQRSSLLTQRQRLLTDLAESVRAAEDALAAAEQAVAAEARQPSQAPIVVKSQGTPISQTVHGSEAHFQLREGRVAYVPVEELIEQFEDRAKDRVRERLNSSSEVTDTVGPVDGFRMRFTLVRFDVPGGWAATLREYTMLPVAGQIGQPIEEALASGSKFRNQLGGFDPRDRTITLWTYPDSFAACRALNEELHRLGYRVACRPLPDGQPISGSPLGSRSAAQ